MPVSRYPRPGHRLAPQTLRSIMCAPAVLDPSAARGLGPNVPPPLLSELDETVWTQFGADTTEALARQVIEHVRQALPFISPQLANRHLPAVPGDVSLDDLSLETRTRNSLAEEGYEEDLESLLRLSIGDLLEIPGFGARCLVDLLTSLEDFDISVVRYPWASRRFAQILAYEIDNLLTNPNVSLIHRDDPRFQELLQAVQGLLPTPADYFSLRDLIESVRTQAAETKKPVELINALQDVRIRVDGASSMVLEDELLDVIPISRGHERNRSMLYRRMGWDGGGRRTLQEVADEFGLTRESVRKICNRLLDELERRKPFTPTLNRALTVVMKTTPSPTPLLESLLQKDGLSRSHFDLESLLSAGDVLSWETGIAVETTGIRRYALHARQAGLPGLILDTAKESVTHWGMANVGDVSAKVAASTAYVVETRFVVQVLERADGLEWLDAPGGWFWLSTVRHNRLLNQIKKIMAVAHSLDVGDLRRGIARHHRMEGFAPPPNVLLELCRQQALYEVQGDTVTALPGLDRHDVLGEVEKVMVEVLAQHNGVMRVEDFERECRNLGIKESTFFTYLDYSPLFTKHARGLYGLRGTVNPKGFDQEACRPRDHRRVLLEHKQDDVGRAWLRYRLSRAAIVGGIVGIPSAMTDSLRGEYRLLTGDGTAAGTLMVDSGLAWRLAPYFRLSDAKPGDELRLELDPITRRAVAAKGNAPRSLVTADEAAAGHGDAPNGDGGGVVDAPGEDEDEEEDGA